MVRPLCVAPADVKPHLLPGDVADGVVDGPDVQRHHLLEYLDGVVLVSHMAFHGQVRAVQLQHDPSGGDQFVFLAHLFRQGHDVFFVGGVVGIAQSQGYDSRRCGAHEQVLVVRI